MILCGVISSSIEGLLKMIPFHIWKRGVILFLVQREKFQYKMLEIGASAHLYRSAM